MKWTKVVSLTVVLLFCIKDSKGFPQNEFISHYEAVNLEPSVVSSTVETNLIVELQFTALGREFALHLETHKRLFEPDFHLLIIGKNGEETRRNMDTRVFVNGYNKGDSNSTAHGSLHDDAFSLVINSHGEAYHIEPAHKYSLHSADYNSIIYRASDVKYNLKHTHCSSADSTRLTLIQQSAMPSYSIGDRKLTNLDQLRKKRVVASERNTCTVKIVADYQFFTGAGNSHESTTIDLMMQHIMAADSIFRSTSFISGNGDPLLGFGVSVHSAIVYTDPSPSANPLLGDFSTSELLEAFSEMNFDDVCLGHLFTYRDFSGVVGLAYLADPNGQLVGGICQTRTTTAMGRLNLNTGFTSLLNFGRTVPQAISFIITTHEIGHNHGSPHDPPECTPEGSEPKFIMFPSTTTNGLKEFSECSRKSIGATLDVRSSLCFTSKPLENTCGNGIVERGEECDCGAINVTECSQRDPCCTVNCTLIANANCSAQASPCCNGLTCQPLTTSIVCLTGDTTQGGCQDDSKCDGVSPTCPQSTPADDGTPCNEDNNVCQSGSCTGSPCSLYNNSKPCFCTAEEELCDVCCLFHGDDGECTSTFNTEGVPNVHVQPGYSCANFTGFCTAQNTCFRVNNDDALDKLRDILLGFTSIPKWLENNWYWILVGFACLIILVILIQVTYRRKKIKTDDTPDGSNSNSNRRKWGIKRKKRGPQRDAETYGYFQTTEVDEDTLETSNLLTQGQITQVR